MASEFRHRRRVEFSETDAAGIVHFSNYLRFMESAEHAFLRSLGVTADGRAEGRRLGWPRVSVKCDFSRPLHFGDELEIHLLVRRRGTKSITYELVFHRCDESGAPAEEVARGEMIVVCVELAPGQPLKPVPIPRSLAERIEPAG